MCKVGSFIPKHISQLFEQLLIVLFEEAFFLSNSVIAQALIQAEHLFDAPYCFAYPINMVDFLLTQPKAKLILINMA